MPVIQEVVNAQIYLPEGLSGRRELQLLVHEEGCDGDCTVETIAHKELLDYLNKRRHVLYKTGDEDTPKALKDRNGEVVLAMCRRCKKAEVELDLTTPCISERELALREAAAIARQAVYNGDYYTVNTDRQDEICHWIERRILELITKPDAV